MTEPLVMQPPVRMDGTNAPELQSQWLERLEQHPGAARIVIDLGELDYVSSAGLRVFLVIAKAARQRGGDLALAAPKPPVADVLQISGFDRIMTVRPSIAEALAANQ